MSREMDLLLVALDQAYEHKSWHGTNLKGALRGLSAEEAVLDVTDQGLLLVELAPGETVDGIRACTEPPLMVALA